MLLREDFNRRDAVNCRDFVLHLKVITKYKKHIF